jgi:hypothetical protein
MLNELVGQWSHSFSKLCDDLRLLMQHGNGRLTSEGKLPLSVSRMEILSLDLPRENPDFTNNDSLDPAVGEFQHQD